MTPTRLELVREAPVLRVWLARPERRNALDATALQEIAELFTALRSDFAIRVVVLGGRGPSFCAGADRRDPPGRVRGSDTVSDRERRWVAQLGLRACRAVEEVDAVTVARLHGHAVGGGAALALACDLRVAAEDAVLQIPEVELGLPLTWGAVPRLVQEVGAARAREIILLGEPIGALRAERLGLVHRVVPGRELDGAVDAWARRLAAQPELAVHATKTQFRAYAARSRLGDATEADGDALALAARTAVARASFRGDPD